MNSTNRILREITLNGIEPSIIEEIHIPESGSTSYIGYCVSGLNITEEQNKWCIKRVVTTSAGNNTLTTIQYAAGSNSFDQIWANRATLEYSY